MITIMGATAGGKTGLASRLAKELGAEIISADSRQVYRGMNIGTGKDLTEYVVDGTSIRYHLIDIVDAGYRYNVFEYQRDFRKAYDSITAEGKPVILCGGSGMYIEAVVDGYNLMPVPPDPELRNKLESKSFDELKLILSQMKKLHNKTDIDNKKRTVRAIEIEYYLQKNGVEPAQKNNTDNIYFEIRYDRDTRRDRITDRLRKRLDEGMIDEVENLMNNGLSYDDMLFYGLEYKYIANYLMNKLDYDGMFSGLNTAIHRFAKRQMTWFRGMERKGAKIHAVDGTLNYDSKVEYILNTLRTLNVKYN